MVTRGLAKTTKVKKNFIDEKKKVQKNTQLSFWWKAKSSSYECAFEDFIFVVGSAANLVGTTLEFTAFGSGPDVKPGRGSAFCFFSVHNHGFCGGPNIFSQKKTPMFIVTQELA